MGRTRKPVLLDFITSSDERATPPYAVLSVSAEPGAVLVTQYVGITGELVDRTFTWTGTELVADRPLPEYPEADTAP